MRALSRPAVASRHTLHALRVTEVEELTDDALAITFAVPEELRAVYAFAPGQHVALVRDDGGDEIRRSYSVCTQVGGPLRVAVKLLPGGAFSGWAHEELKVGDELQVMSPSGRFTVDLDRAHARHYAAVAAGSGITPVMSILASALAVEPASRCTLIYGNRSTSSVMFLEELQDLKDRYGPRLQLIHVLSREPQDVELLEGRIDGPKLERLLDTLLEPDSVDGWFLCGPFGMVEASRSTLLSRGVPAAAIHRELFHGDDAAPAPEPRRPAAGDQSDGASVTLVLDGRRSVASVPEDGAPILDVMLAARPDAPYACKGGVCGTCRCRVTEGEVRMDHAYALEPDEIEAGIVLACQSHPVTDTVVLDFDVV
jgi:ring-1,2-phenylacetyl-CoA epoxidase subunit PaaE